MNTTKKVLIFATILILIGIVVIIATESRKHWAGKLYDNYVLDNRNHYLTCHELPSVEEVDKVVSDNRGTVEQIFKELNKGNDAPINFNWNDRAISDGYNSFIWGQSNPDCDGTGGADIVIGYMSHSDRILIEEIINNDTFFGIPYRLLNY